MGIWTWQGIAKSGKRESGTVEAKTDKEARALIRAKGVKVKVLNPPSILDFDLGDWLSENGYVKQFGNDELLSFTKQMNLMLETGIPIAQALEISYKATKNISLKKTIRLIIVDISEGKPFHECLEKHKGFDRLYCNLVKSGEAGGVLDIIFEKLASHIEKQQEIVKKVKKAMAYPLLVLVVGIVVVWGLMVFVVPQFVSLLTDSGQQIPFITQLVIDASDFFSNNTIFLLPFVFISFISFNKYIQTPYGKRIYDNVILKAPLFGLLEIKGELSSFSRILATLLSSGISLVDGLEICSETIGNTVIRDDIKKVKREIEQGKTLTEPLSRIEYFPEMLCQMIKIGEETGKMDEMFNKVSLAFDEEVNDVVDNLTSLIEPLIIVLLGSIIGTVMIAMYLPMFLSAGAAA